MKLYNVTLELEVMVMAETATDAVRIAHSLRAFEDDLNCNGDADAEAKPACYLPGLYGPDELVYHGGGGDITVAQAAKQCGQEKLLGMV